MCANNIILFAKKNCITNLYGTTYNEMKDVMKNIKLWGPKTRNRTECIEGTKHLKSISSYLIICLWS